VYVKITTIKKKPTVEFVLFAPLRSKLERFERIRLCGAYTHLDVSPGRNKQPYGTCFDHLRTI
jgi:hypothetical protein